MYRTCKYASVNQKHQIVMHSNFTYCQPKDLTLFCLQTLLLKEKKRKKKNSNNILRISYAFKQYCMPKVEALYPSTHFLVDPFHKNCHRENIICQTFFRLCLTWLAVDWHLVWWAFISPSVNFFLHTWQCSFVSFPVGTCLFRFFPPAIYTQWINWTH